MDLVREHDIRFDDFRKYLFHEESNLPEGYVGVWAILLLQQKIKEVKSLIG